MESAQQKQHRLHLEQQLTQQLQTLRGALTHLSLLLDDLHFEVDASERQAAMDLAAACIARSQSRQH